MEKEPNVIFINEYGKNIKFCTSTIWVDWREDESGRIIKKQFCVISVKDLKKNVEVIHPISEFILNKYSMKKYNTQRKHANNVVKFLNFLLENQKKLGIYSLKDLKVSTGNKFLNSLDSKRSTIIDMERTLTLLYLFLSHKGCMPEVNSSEFVKKQNFKGDYYYESPFNGVIYPPQVVSNVEHIFPEKYIPLLLEISILVAQPIALGIYLQLFGGLRVGEVVNLKRFNLKRKINSGDILVKLQNQFMRTDIKDSSGSNNVKVSRNQRVFQVKDWLDILSSDHIEIYKPLDGSGALFVNRDGKAMTGRSYRQYFDKVKKYFIRFLMENGDAEDRLLAQHLKFVKWSTHIGRGTFTNLLASNSENPLEIAFMRGDKNILTSLIYMAKTDRMRKKLEEKFNDMHQRYIPKLIDRRFEKD